MPVTELHKEICRLIWLGHNNLSILDELCHPRGRFNLNLNDDEESAMQAQINRLRREIQEARACAQEAAEEAIRQGKTWQETVSILQRPALLSALEITGIVSRAQAAVKGE